MDSGAPIDIEAFAMLAAQRGLKIENEDMLQRLHQGYCALQGLLTQLPQAPDPAVDPALLFLGDGTEINR